MEIAQCLPSFSNTPRITRSRSVGKRDFRIAHNQPFFSTVLTDRNVNRSDPNFLQKTFGILWKLSTFPAGS